MGKSGFDVTICKANSLLNKKIELGSRKLTNFCFTYTNKINYKTDICIIPSRAVAEYYSDNMQIFPPLISFGNVEAMSSSLAMGCIDYLCTPWTVEELFLRINLSFLKNYTIKVSTNNSYIHIKGRTLFCTNAVSNKTASIKLTAIEEEVFSILSRNKNMYFSREQIALALNKKETNTSRAIDMSISRLKLKIDTTCKKVLNEYHNPIINKPKIGWRII